MMKNQANQHWISLQSKLQLLAQGQDIGLTPEEAAIYGVEDADVYSPVLEPMREAGFLDESETSDSI